MCSEPKTPAAEQRLGVVKRLAATSPQLSARPKEALRASPTRPSAPRPPCGRIPPSPPGALRSGPSWGAEVYSAGLAGDRSGTRARVPGAWRPQLCVQGAHGVSHSLDSRPEATQGAAARGPLSLTGLSIPLSRSLGRWPVAPLNPANPPRASAAVTPRAWLPGVGSAPGPGFGQV